jgi:hypothetical protein
MERIGVAGLLQGLEWTVDDTRSVIKVRGSKTDIEHARTYLALFDVRPRKVSLKIEIDSLLDKSHFTSILAATNNQSYVLADPESGVKISLSPRINDDNTVSLFSATTYGDHTTSYVARLKFGATMFFYGDAGPQLPEGPDGLEIAKPRKSYLPVIRVQILKNDVTYKLPE